MNLSEQIERIKNTPERELILVIDIDKERRLTRVYSHEVPTAYFQGYLGINKGMSNKSKEELNLENITEIASISVYDLPGQLTYESSKTTVTLDENTFPYIGLGKIIGFLMAHNASRPLVDFVITYYNKHCLKAQD